MSKFNLEGFPSNDGIEIEGAGTKSLQSPPQMRDGAIRIPINLPDPSILADLLKNLEDSDSSDPAAILSAFSSITGGSASEGIASFLGKLGELAMSAAPMLPEKSLSNAKNLMYDKILKDAEKKFSDGFLFVECERSENLFQDFKDTFGTKDTYNLDDMFRSLGNLPLNVVATDKAESEILDFIGEINPITWTEKFILTAGRALVEEGNTENYSPVFLAFYKTNGQWGILIPPVPKCVDTDSGSVDFISESNYNDLFTEDGNPIFFNPSLAMMSCELAMFSKERAITKISDVGEFKHKRPAKIDSGNYLSIGVVKVNDSEQAKMLLADSNMSGAEEVELLLEFPREMDTEELGFFSNIILPVDFEKNQFFKNADLKPGNQCFVIQYDLDGRAFDDGFRFLR